MERKKILEQLDSVIKRNGRILVVSTGSGVTTRLALESGADIVLAINAGRFRQMGQSAFYSLLSCSSANEMVKEFGTHEILTITEDECPVIAGTFMQDPRISIYEYLKELKEAGFSGVINYPSAILLDGKMRKAMENAGLGYDREVEGIRVARFLDLLTVAYVSNEEEAVRMVEAGADVICVYFGITGSGELGAEHMVSLDMALKIADSIFKKVDSIAPGVIKIINGGPVETPMDVFKFYENTSCQGVLAGSLIERIPVEEAVSSMILSFTGWGYTDEKNTIARVMNRRDDDPDYVEFMKKYVEQNYRNGIRLKDLADMTHISSSRLSEMFKKETGETFSGYLISFRMEQAKKLLAETDLQIKIIGAECGYPDYAQFSKMFKKTTGISPKSYREENTEGIRSGMSV